MAHAASRRRGRPGNEPGHGLPAILLDPRGGFLFRAAADFPNNDDAVCVGVAVEKFNHVQMRQAGHRIAANAHTGALARTATGQLPDRFVSERAAA